MQLEIADARTPKKVSTTSIWFDRGRKWTAEPAEPAERGPKRAWDTWKFLEGVGCCDQIWGANLLVFTTGNWDSWLFMFGFNHLHSPQNDLISMFLLLVGNISLLFPRLLESIPKFDDKLPSLDYFIYHITTISRSIPSWSICLLGLPMKNNLISCRLARCLRRLNPHPRRCVSHPCSRCRWRSERRRWWEFWESWEYCRSHLQTHP